MSVGSLSIFGLRGISWGLHIFLGISIPVSYPIP
jgi:hypothetical protein